MDALAAAEVSRPGLPAPRPGAGGAGEAQRIGKVAQEFEAAFLAEMLKHAGLGQLRQSLGGGPGEAAFTDFLVREYAREIARTRPLGIGERVRAAVSAERAR